MVQDFSLDFHTLITTFAINHPITYQHMNLLTYTEYIPVRQVTCTLQAFDLSENYLWTPGD